MGGPALREHTNQMSASDRLTARELSSLRLVAYGKSTDQLAEAMKASPAEIACILWSVCRKLGVTDLDEAVLTASSRGYF